MSAASTSGIHTTKDAFDDYKAGLENAALKPTKHSAALPSDVSFYKSIDRDIAINVDECSDKALSLVNRLLELASTVDNKRTKGKGKAKLEDEDDLVDRFESVIVESMDRLLEGVVRFSLAFLYSPMLDVDAGHFPGSISWPYERRSYRCQADSARA